MEIFVFSSILFVLSIPDIVNPGEAVRSCGINYALLLFLHYSTFILACTERRNPPNPVLIDPGRKKKVGIYFQKYENIPNFR